VQQISSVLKLSYENNELDDRVVSQFSSGESESGCYIGVLHRVFAPEAAATVGLIAWGNLDRDRPGVPYLSCLHFLL